MSIPYVSPIEFFTDAELFEVQAKQRVQLDQIIVTPDPANELAIYALYDFYHKVKGEQGRFRCGGFLATRINRYEDESSAICGITSKLGDIGYSEYEETYTVVADGRMKTSIGGITIVGFLRPSKSEQSINAKNKMYSDFQELLQGPSSD